MAAAWDGPEHTYEVPVVQRVVLGVVLVPMLVAGLVSVVVLRIPGLLFLAAVATIAWKSVWLQPYRVVVHPDGAILLQSLGTRTTLSASDVTSVAFRQGPRLVFVIGGVRESPMVARPGDLLRDLLALNLALDATLTNGMRKRLERTARRTA